MRELLLLLCITLCGNAYAADIMCKDDQIGIVVKRLNKMNDISIIKKDFDVLSQQAYQAVGCLINELSIVKETRIAPEDFDNHKHALHVIWCIRAIRYLTEIDFKGKTTYVFKKKEGTRKHFLTLDNESEMPFFSTTMSHEVIYIAPKDTQMEIIEKWKKWYLIEGKDFRYKSSEDFDKWFY